MSDKKKKKKATKTPESKLAFELIGGVFITETFSDGRKTMLQLDGETILYLVRDAVVRGIELLEQKGWKNP